ncbi:unnamed protein product [Anisakis simplex]|uniref:Secreted protein n=1 Tax=Anisakis simplex TaxID=6269 RepID=A0A0M3JYG9_ANISI|nr:unnamed protein product [Anisakis simplex]
MRMKRKVSPRQTNHHTKCRTRSRTRDIVPHESPSSYHLLVLIALSTICFSTNLNGDFVFDDREAILNNAVVQGERPLWDVFRTDFWGRSIESDRSHKSYRPITTFTFM